MARVKFGTTVVGLRGTISGVVFSQNANAAYAMRWQRPRLSMSDAVQTTRIALSNATKAWQSLNSTQKSDWATFALSPNEVDYDPWGSVRYLTAPQWYTRACARRALVGLAPSTDVPTGGALVAPSGFSLSLVTPGAGNSSVSWDSGEFAAGESAILYLSLCTSIGQTDSYRGWRLTLAMQNPGDTGEDITANVLTAFGSFPAHWQCFGRLHNQAALGNRSAASFTSCEVAES